jgi:hypothetical protein
MTLNGAVDKVFNGPDFMTGCGLESFDSGIPLVLKRCHLMDARLRVRWRCMIEPGRDANFFFPNQYGFLTSISIVKKIERSK